VGIGCAGCRGGGVLPDRILCAAVGALVLEIDVLGINVLGIDVLGINVLGLNVLGINILEINVLEINVLEINVLGINAGLHFPVFVCHCERSEAISSLLGRP
jgi:hypothetical protein